MSALAASARIAKHSGSPPPGTLEIGIGAFAALHLVLALFMAISPHGFYTAVGPFEAFNQHYIRDTATFYAALSFGLAVALRRPSWRVPLLATTAVQYALHSINHLIDIGKAHPLWLGYFDFFTLAAGALLLAWLVLVAVTAQASAAQAGASGSTLEGGSP
jgi:hypothetical protein